MATQSHEEQRDQVRAELAQIESQWQRLNARREALRTVESGLDALIQLEEGGPDAVSTAVVNSAASKQPSLPISRTTSETTPTLITRILAEGEWLSPRAIHDALYELGWNTKSKTPMNVVRNTLADMADRQGRLQKRKEAGGTVRFALAPENDDTPNLDEEGGVARPAE